MKFAESFLMAIRPNRLRLLTPDNRKIRVTWWTTCYDCRDGYEVLFKADTEQEMWAQLLQLIPDALDQLERSTELIERALSQRARIVLRGDTAYEAHASAFQERTHIFFEAIMRSLGARQATKTPPRLRRAGKSERAAFWEYRVIIIAPHMSTKSAIVVRVFPSPYSDSVWTLRVRMPATTDEEALFNQAALRKAIADLSLAGITVEDVTSFTDIEL